MANNQQSSLPQTLGGPPQSSQSSTTPPNSASSSPRMTGRLVPQTWSSSSSLSAGTVRALAPPAAVTGVNMQQGKGVKDSLIQMLLQSATPAPPSVVKSMPGTSPIPPSVLASGLTKTRFQHPAPSLPTYLSDLQTSGFLPIRIVPPNAAPSRATNATKQKSGSEHNNERSIGFMHHLHGWERDLEIVMLDHPYAKPWNWKPDLTTLAKPTKTIFISKELKSKQMLPNHKQNMLEYIDVIDEESVKTRSVNYEKAEFLMKECYRHANFLNPDVKPLSEMEDWEESISKEGWTLPYHRMFNRALKVLYADQLARLAHSGLTNEPIQRRLYVDKTAKRLRQVFASVNWDLKMAQWLHHILCEKLPLEFLTSYADALQSLKPKIPSLIDKLLAGHSVDPRYSKVAREGQRILLKRKWDPAMPSLNEQKLKNLPCNPLIVLVPTFATDTKRNPRSRQKRWVDMVHQLGQVITIHDPMEKVKEKENLNEEEVMEHAIPSPQSTNIGWYIKEMVKSLVQKVREMRKSHPDRPIILIGWGVGAAFCCQVAVLEKITSVVCLGFPTLTLDGGRGEPDDLLFDIKCPVLFVMGQNACQARSDDMEDIRENMQCVTGLVIVGGADDLLRLSHSKKKSEGITQSMVDKCIMDDVREFLVSVLTSPVPIPIPAPHLHGSAEQTKGSRKTPKKTTRKRKTSTNADGTSPARKRTKARTSNSANPAKGAASNVTSQTSNLSASLVSSAAETTKSLIQTSLQPTSTQDVSRTVMASSPLLSSALLSPSKTVTSPKMSWPLSGGQPHSTEGNSTQFPTSSTSSEPQQKIAGPSKEITTTTSQSSSTPILAASTSGFPKTQFLTPSTVLRMIPSTKGKDSLVSSSSLTSSVSSSSPLIVIGSQANKQAPLVISKASNENSKEVTSTTISAQGSSGSSTPKQISALPSKEGGSLYILTLPSDQVKGLENPSNNSQYSGQVLTLLSQGKGLKTVKNDDSSSAAKNNESRNVELLTNLGSSNQTSSTSPKSENGKSAAVSSETAKTSLASIHAKNNPSPKQAGTSSPKILSNSGGSGKTIRVLQGGSYVRETPSTQIIKTTSSSTSGTPVRSRKQVFVTSASKDSGDDSQDELPKDASTSGQSKSSSECGDKALIRVDTSMKESQDESLSARPFNSDDQDILEEDVHDISYVPYAKKRSSSKQTVKSKAKGSVKK